MLFGWNWYAQRMRRKTKKKRMRGMDMRKGGDNQEDRSAPAPWKEDRRRRGRRRSMRIGNRVHM